MRPASAEILGDLINEFIKLVFGEKAVTPPEPPDLSPDEQRYNSTAEREEPRQAASKLTVQERTR